ncbi:MAG: CD1375 family protein [Clostridium sp.]
MWLNLKLSLYILMKGDVKDMVTVYVALIVAGKKTYKQVPALLQTRVSEELKALDLADLIVA